MKNIFVTNHAVYQQYMLFHKNENFNREQYIEEIIHDFQQDENKIENFNSNSQICMSNKVKYVFQKKNRYIIKSVLPIDAIINFKNPHVMIRDKKDIEEKAKKDICMHFRNRDYIILQNRGFKKTVFNNGYVMECKFNESKKDKLICHVINYVCLKKIKTKKDFTKFRQEYFSNTNDNQWEILLNDFNLMEKYHDLYKENEYVEPEIKVYKSVLKGELKKFPKYFWKEEAYASKNDVAILLTRYLFDDILKWDKYEIIRKVNSSIFKKYKLSGMLDIIYNKCPQRAICQAYSNIMPWDFKNLSSTWFFSGLLNRKEDLSFFKNWLITKLKDNGYRATQNKALLAYDWNTILDSYNVLDFITNSCEDDTGLFFKTIFDIKFSDEEIKTYDLKFSRVSKYVNLFT